MYLKLALAWYSRMFYLALPSLCLIIAPQYFLYFQSAQPFSLSIISMHLHLALAWDPRMLNLATPSLCLIITQLYFIRFTAVCTAFQCTISNKYISLIGQKGEPVSTNVQNMLFWHPYNYFFGSQYSMQIHAWMPTHTNTLWHNLPTSRGRFHFEVL